MQTDIKMDGDKMCIAWFKKKIKKYILTTKAEPVDGGTVIGAGTYKEGTVVTVEAIPAVDFEFDHWGGDVSGKWSGLGMNVCPYFATDEEFNTSIDTLLANGFTELRVTPINYEDAPGLAQSKAAVIRTIAKGADVIWGITTATTLTSSNWSDYSDAVLAAATWAQANGVYEFHIGNELESVIDEDTLIWSQLFTNLKALATDVQAIFTNGNISYCTMSTWIGNWVAAGKGDIDLLACNIYRGEPSWDYWKTDITNLVSGFGVNGTYLTEINLHWDDIDLYSTDEAVQAAAITEMIDYIKASGMIGASFHLWYHPTLNLGVLKNDGTYRQLWQSLLNSE